MAIYFIGTVTSQECDELSVWRPGVCGIIFAAKHVENSGFIRHVQEAVINPRAKTQCEEALGKMAQALFAYPDWM